MKKTIKALTAAASKATATAARHYRNFIAWSYKAGGGASTLPGNI